ncbi:acyl--CoA ligase [Rhodobacteraceae bacterium F11138]|nr:acyl--CoA ligase [Rhodobacteraceae bacterium F11138]
MISNNLGKCFDAAQWADKAALIEPGDFSAPRRTSFAELDAECDAVARGLVARGYRPGDAIGILAQNSREQVCAYLGIMRAGMVAVPFSFKLNQKICSHIVRDSGMKAVFCDPAYRAMLTDTADMPEVLSLERGGGFEDLLDPGPFDTFEPQERELAMILYTSGSTGNPKGVLLSHASQRWSLERGAALYGDRASNCYIVAAPMFHMNATISLKSALACGATTVLLPTFDAESYARSIQEFGVTALTSVPTMLALVAKESERLGHLDFSSVQEVMMGSAPLTQALIDKVQAIFPGARISNSYGTTEGGPSPFGPHPDGIPRPPLSLGYPAPELEVELRESDQPDQGVFYVRSPMRMEGYRNLPEKTAEVLKDGWYRSGDIMRRDADGFFYFVGRADDMFNVGGENVWPGEVEKLIESLPGVHQACVVPVPHETKHLAPFAWVVLQNHASLSEEDVKKHTLDNGPAFAHPRHVHFLQEIPLAGTNKPDRKKLEALARQETERLKKA